MSRESLLRTVWRQNRLLPLLILTLLCGNIVIYALLATVVWPRLAEQERAFIALQSQVRSGRHELRSPQELYRQGQQDLERFRSILPESGAFPQLLDDISGLAQETGVKVSSINYLPKELPDERLLAYSLQFSVSGGYGSVKRFLQELENSRRLIEIESLNVASSKTNAGIEQVTFALKLITYFRSEQP